MKTKWQAHWTKHARLLSEMSPCCRRKVGAVIIDQNNNPVSAGFNGTPRGFEGALCGGDTCQRDTKRVKSGTSTEIGCLHAEANALMQAARKGISIDGCSLVVTCPPCLNCAKYIGQSGIAKVVIAIDDLKFTGYSTAGAEYLIETGVEVIYCLDTSKLGDFVLTDEPLSDK